MEAVGGAIMGIINGIIGAIRGMIEWVQNAIDWWARLLGLKKEGETSTTTRGGEVGGNRQHGGPIDETGLYLLHRGEYVIPATVMGAGGSPVLTPSSSISSTSLGPINITVSVGGTSASPDQIGQAIAKEIRRLL